MRRASPAVWLYRLLIGLFPPALRRDFGEEMAEVFARQWTDAIAHRRRAAVAARAFGRLPRVVAAEWWDTIRQIFRARRGASRRGGSMSDWGLTVRHAARSLRRSPGFTFGVVVLLGLGVGSVSAIWAIVDHVLLRPLPYPAVERLFEVQNGSHSGPAFEEFQAMSSVEAWAAVTTREARLIGAGEPLRVVQVAVTPAFLEMFGARPAAGRLLVPEDHGGSDAIVLSHGTWLRVWGGDAAVIGRTVRIDDRPVVIVGVLDPSFVPPEALTDPSADVWRPLDRANPDLGRRTHHVLRVAGRLAPGAALEDAQRQAEQIAVNRARAFPDQYVERDGSIREIPIVPLQESTVGGVRRGLTLLLAAVGVLLLVACANVTHLFLARAVERVREMSVRRALGAGTSVLAGQLLVESVLLGLGGAAFGVGLAELALRAFKLVDPGGLPRVAEIAIDARVVAFSALVGMTTAVLFGLIPALRIGGGSAIDALRAAGRSVTGSRRAQAMRSGIVVAEVALSLMLVAQAGWLMRSFIRLHQQPLGFRTEHVITLPLTPTSIETPEEWARRMEGIRAALAQVPGVSAATFGLTMPLQWTGGARCCWSARIAFDGEEGPLEFVHPVETGYFHLFGLRVLAGRTWSDAEARAHPRPAVVSEPLAVEVFGSAPAAVGRTFTNDGTPFHIVGVVADNRHYGADQEHGNAIYVPIGVVPFVPMEVHMAVLAENAPPDIAARLRGAVARAEPELPVPIIRRMSEWAAVATAQSRFESALFAVFAAVALLLVAGGLAGTLLYMVRLQRKDLGIRLALGASAGRLERRVLVRGVGMAAVGAALGAAGAWGSGRLIESRLFGLDARDTGTLALATVILLVTALLSSWLPAKRAATTDPMESLRAE